MRQSQLCYFLLIITVVLASCKSDSGEAPAGKNEVSGTIKDEDGRSYPKAKVQLIGAAETETMLTDADGSFGFDVSVDGTYRLTITPPLSTKLVSKDTLSLDLEAGIEQTAAFIIQPQTLNGLLVLNSIDVFGEIRNEAGGLPDKDEEPLYARNVFDPPIGKLTPITAPDNHHVTLLEWRKAQGTAKATCDGNSASIAITLAGMIPNGTYTFWLDFLTSRKTAGQPINLGSDIASIEPVGSGTLNIAKADANGNITAIIKHPSCVLTKEVGLVLLVDYHINGNTYGSAHIPDEEDVSHMLFYFQ
ncbi:MAG: carboxypeptidase-like regulatory domain-containing protein [Imperialibacter sp.]|uniref:carboxypeptidase-like regulatory domain-containing protein n=1 Tax=Imperialibacter sp. TaxID=2038411 RepID=UPI0032EEBC08